MKIDFIDQFERFDDLKANWEAVYAADPEASLFLSWSWMSKWLHEMKSQWIIIAARPTDDARNYVAFFPLRVRTRAANDIGLYTEICMAGSRFADYTGFICAPQFVEIAIPAFASALKSMKWGAIAFESARISDKNMKRLLDCFADKEFEAHPISTVEPETGIDHSICPHLALPNDWNAYLGTLSEKRRSKLRRALRRLDNDPELHITHVGAETLDRDVESLLDLWGRQWGERKKDRTTLIQQNWRVMLKHYFDLGVLFMPILWKSDKAVGAFGCLIDTQKKTLLLAIGARDKTFCKPSPAFLLHAHSIRHAIKQGLKEYDFLRGNEDYKYAFGARDRRIRNFYIRLKPSADKKSILDARSIPEALAHIYRRREAGNLAAAEVGYRQVLTADARCAPALWGYGHLKLAQGHVPDAQKLFDSLIALGEVSYLGSLGRGHCCAVQEQWAEARTYYRRTINLNPEFIEAHYHLGVALERNGEPEEAILSYQNVIAQQPCFRDVKARLANAVRKRQSPSAGTIR